MSQARDMLKRARLPGFSGAHERRFAFGLLACPVLFLVGLALGGELAANAGPPSYRTTAALLPELWKQRFPVTPIAFEADARREVIRAYIKTGVVYYYRFLVRLPRPRVADGEVKEGPGRTVELWLRYRPGEKEPYDLTFVRRDLLPGRSRTILRLKE